jgi:hypothetical protein
MVMKPNSNFKMNKPLKVILANMEPEHRKIYRDAMISAIIAPKVDFKKKKKENAAEES